MRGVLVFSAKAFYMFPLGYRDIVDISNYLWPEFGSLNTEVFCEESRSFLLALNVTNLLNAAQFLRSPLALIGEAADIKFLVLSVNEFGFELRGLFLNFSLSVLSLSIFLFRL